MANYYDVGNIRINLEVDKKDSLSKLDELIKKLKKINDKSGELKGGIKVINSLSKALSNLSENGIKKVGSSVNSITKVFEAISKGTKSLDNINSITKFNSSLSGISKLLETLSNINGRKLDFSSLTELAKSVSYATSNVSNLKEVSTLGRALSGFASILREISKISKNGNDIDWKAMKSHFENLANAIDPLLTKLKQSEASLISFNNILSNIKAKTITQANKELDKTERTTKKIDNNFKSSYGFFKRFINYSIIRLLYQGIAKLSNGFRQVLQYGIDYEETLDKFRVSFGNLSESSERFVNRLTYAFNISSDSIMNYMATFNSMLTAIEGLSGETAERLSENLTKMAIDYSSLFNMNITNVMEQFQSMMSGQVRSIRMSSGIDLTDSTIYQYYKDNGGTKSLTQLSQLEKRLLRIYGLQRQMYGVGAEDNLKDTLNSSANMLKQMQETAKELGKWLGLVLKDYFQPMIQKGLTLLLVMKDVTKSIADARGLSFTNYEHDSVLKQVGDDAQDASDKVDTLLGKLSFDKFEALSSNKSQSSEDLAMIESWIKDWGANLELVSSNARETANGILQWLGFTEDINEETGDIVWKLSDGYTNLDRIKAALKALISMGIGVAIGDFIFKMGTAIKAMKEAKNLSLTLNSALGGILAGTIVNLIINWDSMSKSMKFWNIVAVGVSATLLLIKNRVVALKVIKTISKYFGIDWVVDLLKAKIATLSFQRTLQGTITGFTSLAAALGLAFAVFKNWDDMNTFQRIIAVVGTLTTAIFGLALAMGAFHTTTSYGVAAVTIGLGIAAVTAAIMGAKSQVSQYATGGFPEQGQLFIANEAGPEMVGTMDGKSAVANNQQIVEGIRQGVYQGVVSAMSDSRSNNNININVSGVDSNALARALFTPLVNEFRRNGYKVTKA